MKKKFPDYTYYWKYLPLLFGWFFPVYIVRFYQSPITTAIPYIYSLIFINGIGIMQIHIGFCTVLATAPSIVFEFQTHPYLNL